MRGMEKISRSLFSYGDIEVRVPARHRLRQVKRIVDDVLVSLVAEFAWFYVADERPPSPLERLMCASLTLILFPLYNWLFRWFAGLGVDDPVWVPTVLTKSRDRRLTTDVLFKLLAPSSPNRDVMPLLSDEHFSVDGTLIMAWVLNEELPVQADLSAA